MADDDEGADTIRAYRSLSLPQLELLRRIESSTVDVRMIQSWSRVGVPVEEEVAHFLRLDLIEEATLLRKLDIRFRVVDLKQLLVQRGVSPRGRKVELIDQLIGVLGAEAAKGLVDGMRFYSLTALGKRIVGLHTTNQQRIRNQLEKDVFARLNMGDVASAGALVAEYECRQLFARGLGIDWSRGYPESELRSVMYLLSMSYPDLVLHSDDRRVIGISLALSLLLGEGPSNAGRRLLNFLGGSIDCPDLIRFLMHEPCGGYARSLNPSSPEDVAELYAHTKLGEALMMPRLREYVARGRGIGIVPVRGDHCPQCNTEPLEFARSEVDAVPKLPRHWGCRCTYVPLVERFPNTHQ